MRASRAMAVVGSLALAFVAPSACASEGSDPSGSKSAVDPAIPAGAYRGTSEGGDPIIVSIDDDGRALVTWSTVPCERDGEADTVENNFDPYDAEGSVSGKEFQASAGVIENGYDGDFQRVDIEVTGALGDAGTIEGTLVATDTFTNGQGEALDDDYQPSVCETGSLAWTATLVDDQDLGPSLWAFRAAANDDLDSVEALIEAGVAPDVTHPLNQLTLTDSIDPSCIGSDGNGELGVDRLIEGDEVTPFPSDDAASTIAGLQELGAPAPTGSSC